MSAIKDMLEGKPLRSPIHPAIVHLPIALFPLALLLDAITWFLTDRAAGLVRAAYYAHMLGIGTALVAALFGFVDYSDIRRDHPARKTATRHLVLNLIAVGLFAVSAWLRRDLAGALRTPVLPLAITTLGVAVLSYAGYLGGRIVYDDGVAVGRHRRRGRPPRATIVASDEAKRVCVGDESALPDGGTLRARVNGTVITIVRTKAALHAFQEFCTHRYGPLSEGRIDGCEVMCPWHRSRFDIRTGKVTAGPAKVDLKTFKVEVREGRIWIEVSPRRE